jgi:hypothetical protein
LLRFAKALRRSARRRPSVGTRTGQCQCRSEESTRPQPTCTSHLGRLSTTSVRPGNHDAFSRMWSPGETSRSVNLTAPNLPSPRCHRTIPVRGPSIGNSVRWFHLTVCRSPPTITSRSRVPQTRHSHLGQPRGGSTDIEMDPATCGDCPLRVQFVEYRSADMTMDDYTPLAASACLRGTWMT